MPTYYSRNTSIQLAVADLQDTTIINPEGRSPSAMDDEVASCAAKFAKASINGTLDETSILTEDANQTHMRCLGEFSEMPFFMVRAGMSFFNSETEGRRSRRPARVPPSTVNPVSRPRPIQPSMTSPSPRAVPQALFLSVFLSKASFLPTYVNRLNKTIFHDVKIDVFFNGELCASAYVSGRYHGDEYEMTEQIVRFSGRRVHRLLEKPWILIPFGHPADGRLRPERQNIGSSGDAEQRWASVSKALFMEANKLEKGRNGELSKLGDYLSALAALEMPTEVEAMQTVGDPKIGIIDVVVTAGMGRKDDSNGLRLMQPTPIRLGMPKVESAPTVLDNVKDRSVFERRSVHQEAVAEAQSPSTTIDETFTTPTKKRRSQGSRADSEILAQAFTFEARGLRSQSDFANDPMSGENHTKNFSREGAQSNDLLTKKSHNYGSFNIKSSSTNPAPRKDHELHSHKPQNKPQSPLVNSFSDVPQGTFGYAPDPKLARPSPVAPIAYMGNCAIPAPSTQRPKGKPRWNWEIVVDNKLTLEEEMESIAMEAARATSKLFTHPSASNRASRSAAINPSGFNEQRSLLRETSNSKRRKLYIEAASDTNDEDDESDNEVIPSGKKSLIVKLKNPRRIRKRPRPSQPLISLQTPSGPGMPPLSEDAVVTYAPGNLLRQVKSERSGWFVEKSILMGVRFLVG